MQEIPLWWLIVSGIGFGVSIVLNIVLIGLGIAVWSRIGPLVADLRSQVKQLGDRANNITTTAKTTVDLVHDRTERILGSADEASASVSQKIGAASAALTTVFVILRIAAFARGLVRESKSTDLVKR